MMEKEKHFNKDTIPSDFKYDKFIGGDIKTIQIKLIGVDKQLFKYVVRFNRCASEGGMIQFARIFDKKLSYFSIVSKIFLFYQNEQLLVVGFKTS